MRHEPALTVDIGDVTSVPARWTLKSLFSHVLHCRVHWRYWNVSRRIMWNIIFNSEAINHELWPY